jgi:hypothetical protein
MTPRCLPAKGLTFTLMAKANRVGTNILGGFVGSWDIR